MYFRKLQQQKRNYRPMYDRMRKRIAVKHDLFDRDIIAQYRDVWRPIEKNCSIDSFLLYSSAKGEVDLNYVPDVLYSFPLRHILNNTRYDIYYDDKNSFDFRLRDHGHLFPKTLFRKICGVYYDNKYQYVSNIRDYLVKLDVESLVIKEAVDSTGGKGVCFFKKNPIHGGFANEEGVELEVWMRNRCDLVAQVLAKQNSFFTELNPSSVNTIRVVTYRSVKDERIYIAQSMVRAGSAGSVVDNWHSGGLIIGIDNNGCLHAFGYDEDFNRKPVAKAGCIIPQLNEVYEKAKSIAASQFYHRILAFDFYIDIDDDVKLLEINYDAAPWLQLILPPLFGEHAGEVIDYCAKHRGYQLLVFSVNV